MIGTFSFSTILTAEPAFDDPSHFVNIVHPDDYEKGEEIWKECIRDGKNYNGVKLVGLFQWVWNIDGGFNWYAGPGIGLGAYRFDNPGGQNFRDSFVFLSGALGIEYKFDIPLLLSLDIRPELGFGDAVYDNNDLDFDIGLGIRYMF